MAVSLTVMQVSCVIDLVRDADQARERRARVQIDAFSQALETYRQDVGNYPSRVEGLGALRMNPGAAGWNGPYLHKDIPRDPWGTDYQYSFNGSVPEIVSFGRDRKPGGTGADADISSFHPTPRR